MGVVVASVTIKTEPSFRVELGDFNINAFSGAMISNLAFALRSIFMKRMDDTPAKKLLCFEKNLTTDNVYGLYTIAAFMMAVPVAYAMEGAELWENLPGLVTKQRFEVPTFSSLGSSSMQFVEMHLITGLFFYLYNEASSLALGNLDGVAHAVCNTVKRVVIMIAMSFFDKPLTLQKWIGAGIAIGGTFFYTVVKNAMDAKAKKSKAE